MKFRRIMYHLRFISFLFISIISAFYGCSAENEIEPKPKLDGRIVGGYKINITDAPHQISLQSRFGHICGGSIVAKKWILTAAHCTSGQDAKKMRVRLGTSKYAEGGDLVNISKIVQHEKFNYSTIDWDYSLLELENEIEFDDQKQPIKLPELGKNQELEIVDGTMCKVTGWGNTLSSNETRNWLREAEVPIVNRELCTERYEKHGGITERMICAGYDEGGKDSCQGDSGGPLVTNGTQYGVVSWGYGCAKPEYPGVYSRVAVVRDWIKENTGI